MAAEARKAKDDEKTTTKAIISSFIFILRKTMKWTNGHSPRFITRQTGLRQTNQAMSWQALFDCHASQYEPQTEVMVT